MVSPLAFFLWMRCPREALQRPEPRAANREKQEETAEQCSRERTDKDLEGAPAPGSAGVRAGAHRPAAAAGSQAAGCPAPSASRAGQVVGLLSATCSCSHLMAGHQGQQQSAHPHQQQIATQGHQASQRSSSTPAAPENGADQDSTAKALEAQCPVSLALLRLSTKPLPTSQMVSCQNQ